MLRPDYNKSLQLRALLCVNITIKDQEASLMKIVTLGWETNTNLHPKSRHWNIVFLKKLGLYEWIMPMGR
jgi:hypothetical protein